APLSNDALVPVEHPETLATAIKIGSPVSWKKSLRAVLATGGQVLSVSEREIADAKAVIGRDGVGCEPASATTVAGIKRLVAARLRKRVVARGRGDGGQSWGGGGGGNRGRKGGDGRGGRGGRAGSPPPGGGQKPRGARPPYRGRGVGRRGAHRSPPERPGLR